MTLTMPILIALIVGLVTVVFVVQGLGGVLLSSRNVNKRINQRLTMLASGMAPQEIYTSLVRKTPKNPLARVAPELYARAETYLRQAGVPLSPPLFGGIVVAIAAGLWLAVTLYLLLQRQGDPSLNALIALGGAIGVTLLGASVWLTQKRTKRLKTLEQQLPLALDIAVRSLRSGHPVIMAIRLAANEMRDPIGTELGLVVDETTYGAELREALTNLARRTSSSYLHFFAITIAIQAQTGGNLAEILNSLNTTIRAQQNLHLRVRALASEGRMSALVLSIIPAALISFVMLLQPGFYSTKVDDPIFWPSVAGTGVMYMVGQYIIHRIVNFKY
jgi:tight adherence protein B